jgi:hypothetical protein
MNAPLGHVWGMSPAQDRVWAQVVGLAPSLIPGRLFVVLQAFIDDSVSKDEYVLAGHIASLEGWSNFAKAWEDLLKQGFGTKRKDGKYHFKMSDMALSEERMMRVPFFYKIIEDNVISSISCRLNMNDFRRGFERAKNMMGTIGVSVDFSAWENPYFLVFRGLLQGFYNNRMAWSSRLPLDHKVDFYFDKQNESRKIHAAWEQYMENLEPIARDLYGAEPRFEQDDEFLALQGADLWAWWVRHWYEEDADNYPDKLKNFDFGKWQGKRRPNIILSIDEDGVVDFLQKTAAEAIATRASQDGAS